MKSGKTRTALLHYSSAPVVGGVEAVMQAHAKVFVQEGFPVSVISGKGTAAALPEGAHLIHLPLLNSQHKSILQINRELENGKVSEQYYDVREQIKVQLAAVLPEFENLIVHNVFTKHFNLPLTDALHQLLDEGKIHHCIAWCHDFSWTSAHSKPQLHDGQSWNFLRTFRPDIDYVVVSIKRQNVLAELFGISPKKIRVIYNGIDPEELYGLSQKANSLIERLNLGSADLVLLMPVRVTQAKNIEFALQVTADLCAKGCSTQTILTGPPDPHDPQNMAYFNQLKEMRADLGMEANFHFLYDEGPNPGKPYILDMPMVAELYRVCDLVFMPSHREGFGMPVLEAGFTGKPMFVTNIPAVEEIAGDDVHLIDLVNGAKKTASRILNWASADNVHQLRLKTRQKYTWLNIFRGQIKPLLVSRNEDS